MSETTEGYYTTAQLMKLFGVTRVTVYRWIDSGKIKAVRTPGGQLRIPKNSADAFLESRKDG